MTQAIENQTKEIETQAKRVKKALDSNIKKATLSSYRAVSSDAKQVFTAFERPITNVLNIFKRKLPDRSEVSSNFRALLLYSPSIYLSS